ncbi:MAG TPA: single-stranded-DNA-specific exonuclease RecJ [Deltaproteobacteria bacterium]|nr:single-stranded-DNA-specific exonuclease RecJ [Deltaproteobacteria bacterium]HOM28268.1 single-stranded-DNA-specific exonuclease RecJ [Deltaproteobacteria bacterium]HPP79473.1 single-stranded-DNA-specific exonuclease RecJ [Deltaproteobacteria bacterium]
MVRVARSWVIRGGVDEEALKSLNFTAAFRSLMKIRGMVDPDQVMGFLTPNLGQLRDPVDMKGVAEACDRIVRALERDETIGVFTDYDVDGVSSAVLIHRFLVGVGAKPPMVFIPDRSSDGYGLNRRGIDELAARGVSLLITADCGVCSREEVAYARFLGMDVIVTDHHEPDGDVPDACAVINPKQNDCLFFGEDLCGAGVVFHLIIALRKALRERGHTALPNLKEELDIVAMATVADAVSLSGVNRILVKEGLTVINSRSRAGISALAEVAGLRKGLLTRDLGFVIGPRINAAGRIADARKAFDLLTTDDAGVARRLALELDSLNRSRQAHEQKVLEDALNMLRDNPPHPRVALVWGEGWHVGVLGIVASRLAAILSRPAIVISVSGAQGTGSGRSVAGVDLHRALGSVSSLLNTFGGHRMAVGFTLDAPKIPDLASALGEALEGVEWGQDGPYEVDLKISPFDLTPAFMDELELLAPYGEGNPEPVFLIPAMEVVDARVAKDGLAKLVLRHSNRLFHTLKTPFKEDLYERGRFLDVAFTPVKVRLNGHHYLYLSLKALARAR